MSKRPFWLALFSLGLLLAPSLARAQLVIDVDPSKFRRLPLAVAPVKRFSEAVDIELKLGLRGQELVMNDLQIAGVFEVLDPKSFLEDPKTSGITETTINFTQWLQVGAEGLIKIGYWANGDTLTLDARLFDVALAKELLKKNYSIPSAQFRRTLHAFADEVVKFYTKEEGIFSTRITASRKLGGQKQIVLMDFDGENQVTLVENGSLNILPSFSAEGTSVYFTSYLANNPDLYRVGAEAGKKPVKISDARGLNVGASASPDGKWIALTESKDGNSEIYVMSPDGANPRRVTNNWGIDTSPSFAPDSKRIAFISDRSGNPQVYTQDITSDVATRLTFQGNYNQSPAWSPKGDKIAFSGRDERLVFDLFIVDVASKAVTRLTQDQGNNEDPSWAPDGQHLVFSSTRSGKSKLYIMNADGTNQRLISKGEGEFATPGWSARWKGSDK